MVDAAKELREISPALLPETYLRTLAVEDAARIHREISLADRLGEALEHRGQDRRRDARGRL